MHVTLIESTPIPTQFYMPNLCLALQLLLDLTTSLDTLKDVLTVLVQLQLGDDDLGWVDTEGNGLPRGLLLDDTLDVDDVFETVDGGDLSLGALVGTTNDGDLIILSDWDGADLKKILLDFENREIADNLYVRCTSHGVPCSKERSWWYVWRWMGHRNEPCGTFSWRSGGLKKFIISFAILWDYWQNRVDSCAESRWQSIDSTYRCWSSSSCRVGEEPGFVVVVGCFQKFRTEISGMENCVRKTLV